MRNPASGSAPGPLLRFFFIVTMLFGCGSDSSSGGGSPGPAAAGARTIVGGTDHTCFLTAGGALMCWGKNSFGQLGNGTLANSAVPVQVTHLTSGVKAVTTGGNHTCALTSAGAVKCWGENSNGQIGNPDGNGAKEPTQVTTLSSGVSAIAAGSLHTCALTSAGGVKCWGDNFDGQLGDGTDMETAEPVQVKGLTSGVAAIAAGYRHTCALTSAGGVKCWGRLNESSTPEDVFGLSSGVSKIAAGENFNCILTASGGVKCWGSNSEGQLGNGKDQESSAPVDVTGLTSGVADIAVRGSHACALLRTGGVKCWGQGDSGELGNGSVVSSNTPVDVSGLTNGVIAIGTGLDHSCAVLDSEQVKCWGNNTYGQLGNGFAFFPGNPVAVAALSSGIATLAAGGSQSCAVTTAGAAKCWGSNEYGQLGDGTTKTSYDPVTVSSMSSGVKAVAVGRSHACALSTSGGVKCWGDDYEGQLGNDGSAAGSPTPVQVTGLTSGVKAIAAGDLHSCAITSAGAVHCWGKNEEGQLGDSTVEGRFTPAAVTGLDSGVTALALGGGHSCALTSAGTVKCWGRNLDSQLGNGGETSTSEPVDVTGLTGVTAIAAGPDHTCALTSAGAVKCWGRNSTGQLGDGTEDTPSAPVPVLGLTSGVKAIAAGGASAYTSHTCAVTTAGALKCWGRNEDGQLGNGNTDSFPMPQAVLLSGVKAIALGNWHSCALTQSHGVHCWGDNTQGQLGKMFLVPSDVKL